MENIFIEIQDYYPINSTTRKISGTLHIYCKIGDLDFDIRGCPVFIKKNHVVIFLPYGVNIEDEKKVTYPYIAFMDKTISEKISNFLKKEGVKFVLDWLKKNKQEKREK